MQAVAVPLLLALLAGATPLSRSHPPMPMAPITAAQLQQQVDAAIANGSPSVDVPGGAYLFNASGGTDFLVMGASQLRIRALAPVTLWFAGGAGINLTDSTDVQLVGSGDRQPAWILDYDPPATHQVITGSTLNLLNCTRVLAEDVTIRAAPYMAVTAWNGGGAHVFRRLIFEKLPGRAKVGLRDATHFSDQRVGPTIEDSVIGFTGDDFFNVHSTLMLVLKCETKTSCLVVNPHLFDAPRNTAYGTNSVMGMLEPGLDTMSFYTWPQSDMRAVKLSEGPLGVASAVEITDPELLAEAATLIPELVSATEKCPRCLSVSVVSSHVACVSSLSWQIIVFHRTRDIVAFFKHCESTFMKARRISPGGRNTAGPSTTERRKYSRSGWLAERQ